MVEKRKGMFRLKRSQDGSFQHKWLINRIMLQGGFWVGRVVRRSTDHEYTDETSTDDAENDTVPRDDQADCAPQDGKLEDEIRYLTQEHAKLKIEESGAALAVKEDNIARESAQRSCLESADRPMVPAVSLSGGERIISLEFFHKWYKDYGQCIVNSPLGYQMITSMIMKCTDNAIMTMDDSDEKVVDHIGRSMFHGTLPETLAESVIMANNIDGRNSPAYLRQQRGIFDIEGDTSGQVLVLTPFRKRLETIPRPESRNMSVSWVVEPVPQVDEHEDKGNVDFMKRRETLKTLGMVRGMWKLMVQPSNRYLLV